MGLFRNKKCLFAFAAVQEDCCTSLMGNCSATVKKYPPTFEDICRLQNELKEKNKWSACIITNWIPIRKSKEVKG